MTNSQRLTKVREYFTRWMELTPVVDGPAVDGEGQDDASENGQTSTILSESILIRDGFYCGRRFQASSYHAVWFMEEDQLKIHSKSGEVAAVFTGEEIGDLSLLPEPAVEEAEEIVAEETDAKEPATEESDSVFEDSVFEETVFDETEIEEIAAVGGGNEQVADESSQEAEVAAEAEKAVEPLVATVAGDEETAGEEDAVLEEEYEEVASVPYEPKKTESAAPRLAETGDLLEYHGASSAEEDDSSDDVRKAA